MYSDEEMEAARQRLLEIGRSTTPDFSSVDEAIFNAYWEEKKDKPAELLNFPINKPQDSKQKSGTGETKDDSPFSVRDGVVTFRGKPTGELTAEERRSLYGSLGNLGIVENVETGKIPPGADPNLYEAYEHGLGDAGSEIRYRLKPEVEQRLYRDGQWYRQVGALRSVGGEGEVSDPSRVIWDEELGYITPMSNVREYDDTVFTPGMLLAAGGFLGAIGMAGGFSGLGIGAATGEAAALPGASSGFPAGAGIAGPTLETAGVSSGALGTGAATTGATTAGVIGEALTVSPEMQALLSQGTAAHSAAAGTAAANAVQAGIGAGGSFLGGIGSAIGGAADWFSGLSPMAQRAIMSAASTGVSGVLANRRQESQQDFVRQQQEIADQRRREEEERARQFAREQQDRVYAERRAEEERAAEERRIRGTPTAMQFNVTPRPGIIGSRIGG